MSHHTLLRARMNSDVTMDSLSLAREGTSSFPKSSKKRASSLDTPALPSKKPKTDSGQVHSDKNKRRRKKKKEPITRDSLVSGLTQNPCRSFCCLSAPPCLVHPPQISMKLPSSAQPAVHIPLRNDRAAQTSHYESKSLHDYKSLLASMVSSLMCQICLDLLYKPFALSPCGHVSCYGCLVNWFNVGQQPDAGRTFSEKTCPQCRAVVRGRPIEAWNVKDMVAAVVNSGLTQDFPQPVEVHLDDAAVANPEALSRDLWANIFPPMLLQPGTLPREGSPGSFGIYDTEDQVHRCLDCMHEIWEGSCSQCGRRYIGHRVDASDNDESGEEHHGISPVAEHLMGWPRSHSVDDSEDGSYEASFIDDDDSERYNNQAVRYSDDGDDPVIGVMTLATEQHRDRAGALQIDSSESGEDGDENVSDTSDAHESQTTRQRLARRTRLQVRSDSDVEDTSGYSSESEDDGSLTRPPMHLFGRFRGGHSTTPEGESVSSQFSESDGNDSLDPDNGPAFGGLWS